MGASNIEVEKRRPTDIVQKGKEQSTVKGSETRESIDRDKKNAHGERLIGASHDNSEIGKSERPTGANLASPLTAVFSMEGESNTTPPTGES